MGSLQYDNAARKWAQYGDGGRVIWTTEGRPAFLLPESNTISWSGSIAFPDFVKGNAMYYLHQVVQIIPGSNTDIGSGIVFARVKAGEWGPDQAGTYLLSRTLLGTAPSGCNYLDVVVDLSCTTAPDLFFFSTEFRYGFKEGQAVNLDGGCAVLEKSLPWVRLIRVVLIDGNVWLERYQSVAANSDCLTTAAGLGSWKSGAQSNSPNGTPVDAWSALWTDDGDRSGWLAFPMNTASGSGGSIFQMRGGAQAPSQADTSDFSSIWSGSIIVRPGYVHP